MEKDSNFPGENFPPEQEYRPNRKAADEWPPTAPLAERPGDTTSGHRQQLTADGESAPRHNPRQAPQGDAARRPRSPQSRKR